MKVALDYDDTLDQAYDLFSIITNSLVACKHEVYIVTHIPEEYREYRENQLKEHNIAYTELVCTGNKLYECQKRGIDYILDDVKDYFKDIKPFYLQGFKIPPLLSKTLEDGTQVEIAVHATFKMSGFIGTEYKFRTKLFEKNWSKWEEIVFRDRVSLEDIKMHLENFKNINMVHQHWNPSTD